jgi:GNAT superfamily N-acetyltransferase
VSLEPRRARGSAKYAIRGALPEDIPGLVALCSEHAIFERATYDTADKAVRLRRALFSEVPRLYAWVGVIDDNLIGYATATSEFSTWNAAEYLHMDCLYVQAQHRGTGIGAALMTSVLQLARARGHREIQWQTPSWNIDACRFYRRQGGVAQAKCRFVLRMQDL